MEDYTIEDYFKNVVFKERLESVNRTKKFNRLIT